MREKSPTWVFEDCFKTPRSRVISILILALIYFLSAKVGQFLSILPGNVTPIWPPSGIALAAIILYGYQMWPGILIGSILGATWALDVTSWITIIKTLYIGSIIAVGVTLQGLAGGYLIKKYIPTGQIFRKPINIIKFFILSVLSCIIGSTVGATTIAFFGFGDWEHYLTIWTTWIVGDSAGILTFTPFILVWFKKPLFKLTSSSLYEIVLLITLLLISTRLIIDLPYNLAYLFIPFLTWGAFRFGLHGATFTLLAISLIADTITIYGYGPFVHSARNEALIGVQFYIAVVGLTGLIMASLLEQLEEYRQNLEEKIKEKTLDLEKTSHKLKDVQHKSIVQDKLSSLGLITAGIAHEIKNPLNFVNNFSELSIDILKDLTKSLQSNGSLQPSENESLHLLHENINSIFEQGKKADNIIQMLLSLGSSVQRSFRSVDIHQFLDESINLTYYAFKVKSSISVVIEKKYDKTLPLIHVVPEDITRVFINVLNNAFYALEDKQNQVHGDYSPCLIVTTKNLGNICEIIIHDNGVGLREKDSADIFTPFYTTKAPGIGVGLGLSISHDVIAIEHGGKLFFRSEEGVYTEFVIELPIEPS